MATLYEIEQSILDCIDTETGEILDCEKLDSLQMEKSKKIGNIARWVKNLRADAAMYKAEKDSFADKQKRAENKAKSLESYLYGFLHGEMYKDAQIEISWKKSKAVNILDEELIPQAYKIPQMPKIDKRGILEDLKDNLEIPGAALEERNNMSIK